MFPEIASAWCMQPRDVISGVDCNKELTHRLQHCQVRGIPHNVLDNIHIQRADYSGNLLAPFALALLGDKRNGLTGLFYLESNGLLRCKSLNESAFVIIS